MALALLLISALLPFVSGAAAHAVQPILEGGTCTAGARERVGDATRSLAVVSGPAGLDVRADPWNGARLVRHFAGRTPERVSATYLVRTRVVDRSCHAAWYRVLLPMRPNGSSGWVRASGLVPYAVHTRITVALRARRLTVYRSGRRMLELPTAVGRPETPTPTGLFYVNERLRTTDPAGAYGPGALGLSAFSPVLTGWERGGPVAIHGTDEPWSVGQAASNGCLRVANRSVLRLLADVPAGTPVVIRP